MRISKIITAATDFNISVDSALRMRVRYLQSLLRQWNAYIDDMEGKVPESDVMAIINELIRIRKYQENRNKGTFKDAITDDMIESARSYPIEHLFDFGKGGRIPCPFHNSKGPDLSWNKKNNTVHCFGACNKTWNSLSVMQERDGMDFISAVKYLNGGV